METLEAVDEYESCRSSVISDLDELEAHLYSCVHHEKNSFIDEEYSAVFNVSSLEKVCQQNEFLGEDDVGQIPSSFLTNALHKSLEAEQNCSQIPEVNQHSESVDLACSVTRNDGSSYAQSSDDVVPTQTSGKHAETLSEICGQSGNSSPSVLEVSSSEDHNATERSLSKYSKPAASTPFKEYVVIDDSDEEVQIELERVKIKSKKKKKRKKSEIKEDIRLNTRNNCEIICLDLEEDFTYSEKENVDALYCDEGNENSEHERSLCKSWTPQMAHFYDESWGGECINVSELQRTMSDDGWKVDVSDEFGFLTPRNLNRRYFGVKAKAWCTKCNKKGHYRGECTEKINPPRCHRCGSSRHQEYSCNQKICLTCGRIRPSLVTVCHVCRQHSKKKCYVCQQPGHPPGCCPDLWRRFHATIVPGEIVTPQKESYKDPKNTYCCNCASRGHHVFQCKKNNFSDYTPMNPKVTSYVDPEVMLEFQLSCSHTSTNWESVGAVAPEYRDESRGSHNSQDRGIKRSKTSGSQQRSKHRKLSDNTTANIDTFPQKHNKKKGKLKKAKEVKTSVSLKIKKGLRPEKRLNKSEKCTKPVDNKDHPKQKSKSKKVNDIHLKKTTAVKDPPAETGTKEKKTTDVNPKTGFVERLVILSPGHLKRIESEEGKEILKYVTDQFRGVTARVVGSPPVLKLMGTGSDIDNMKGDLFDILNNKYGLEHLKKSTGKGIRGKKPNKKTHTTVAKSKFIKKKFQNGAQKNKPFEMAPKDQSINAVSNIGDLQVKIGSNSNKFKKQSNTVHRFNCTFKNGKGNKIDHRGKQYNRENEQSKEGGNHTRFNPSFCPVVKQSFNNRPISCSEVSKYKEDVCENLHNVNLMNNDMTRVSTARPGPSNSKVVYSANKKNRKKKNKNKGHGGMAKDKLRVLKLDGNNGINPVSMHGKKLKKKINCGLDKFGQITVEVGYTRKVFVSDEHNHSRISNNQVFTK